MALRTRLARLLAGTDLSGPAALEQLAQRLDPIAREAARLSRFSVPNRVYAYCFCEVR